MGQRTTPAAVVAGAVTFVLAPVLVLVLGGCFETRKVTPALLDEYPKFARVHARLNARFDSLNALPEERDLDLGVGRSPDLGSYLQLRDDAFAAVDSMIPKKPPRSWVQQVFQIGQKAQYNYWIRLSNSFTRRENEALRLGDEALDPASETPDPDRIDELVERYETAIGDLVREFDRRVDPLDLDRVSGWRARTDSLRAYPKLELIDLETDQHALTELRVDLARQRDRIRSLEGVLRESVSDLLRNRCVDRYNALSQELNEASSLDDAGRHAAAATAFLRVHERALALGEEIAGSRFMNGPSSGPVDDTRASSGADSGHPEGESAEGDDPGAAPSGGPPRSGDELSGEVDRLAEKALRNHDTASYNRAVVALNELTEQLRARTAKRDDVLGRIDSVLNTRGLTPELRNQLERIRRAALSLP